MHDLSFFFPTAIPAFLGTFILFGIVILFAVVVLKGYSLWLAARGGQKWWFIALLILNTLGILEIIYLIWFRPKQQDTATHATPTSSSPVSQP